MTEERKQELRYLLNEAMKNIEIIMRSSGIRSVPQRKSMSIQEYRESIQAQRKSYRPDLTATMLHYYPEIRDNEIKSKLLNCIKTELAEYIREHKPAPIPNYAETIQTAIYGIQSGGTPMGLPIVILLEKFLEIAIASGIEKVISALDKCTRETKGFFQRIIFLRGIGDLFAEIEQAEEVHVSQGIRLVTLPTYPTELPPYLFEDVFSTMLYGAAPITFYGKTLLVIECEVSPLFYKPHVDFNESSYPFQVSIRDAEFPNFDVTKFCQALSLSCNFAVQVGLEWKYIDKDEIFNLRTGSYTGGADRVPIHVPVGCERVSETQILEVKHLYNSLVNLDSGTQEKLQIPIDRWIKSKTEDNPVDKIIDLGVAFEALFLRKNKTDQLALSLRLRAAWHLGKNKAERKELIDEFDAIYTLRSQAVHNGELSPTVKIKKGNQNKPGKSVPTSEFLPRAQELCRNSIINILEGKKFPDDDYWKDLILG